MNSSPSFDIAVVGHYNHFADYETIAFEEFKKSLSEWTHITPWISSYSSMVF